VIKAPNFADLEWLDHGFGLRDTLLSNSALPAHIRTVKQIHSAIVVDGSSNVQEGDAIISDQAGTVVGIKTADCVPVLLVDPSTQVVAAIHAGWRGTAENIVAAAIQQLISLWSVHPGNIRAAIGPSIGACCYEVGTDVARRFGKWLPELENAEGPFYLDLPAINEIQLREAGVRNVWKSGECTFCTPDRFFSFRREREQAGRMMSFIGLQKNIGRTSGGPPGKP
jgi:YfiH family protein